MKTTEKITKTQHNEYEFSKEEAVEALIDYARKNGVVISNTLATKFALMQAGGSYPLKGIKLYYRDQKDTKAP